MSTGSGTDYEERAAARRWPLMTSGLYGPLAGEALCAVLAVKVNPNWYIGMGLLPFALPVMMFTSLLYRNWPTGIRIDRSGIAIGAVAARSGGRASPTVTFQAWGVYRCPWPAVRSARVVTDPDEVRRLRTSHTHATLNNHWGARRWMTEIRIGVLTPPFARALLVVDVDPDVVESPPVRPSRYYANGKGGRMSVVHRAGTSATWIVPTRRPERLAAALRSATGESRLATPDRPDAAAGDPVTGDPEG